MANTLRYNNTVPGNIYYNNAKVQNVYYNNTKVWSASRPFAFTYTGAYETEGNLEGNFVIRFKTSGTLTITSHGNNTSGLYDLFAVGGGGKGGCSDDTSGRGFGGGGGGYTSIVKSKSITSISIVIGAGSSSYGGEGGTTSFGQVLSANGGKSGVKSYNFNDNTRIFGCNGGSGGGAGTGSNLPYGSGGTDGGNGQPADGWFTVSSGKGQGSTTREFGESTGRLYAGGGGGGRPSSNLEISPGGAGGGGNGGWFQDVAGMELNEKQPENGAVNTGGGGGGGLYRPAYSNCFIEGGDGGSGIACMRNHR